MNEELKYQAILDTTDIDDGARRGVNAFEELGNAAEQSGDKMSNMLAKVGAGFLSFSAAKSLVSKVYEVRSSFQDAESSMAVFLGSAEKGKKFFNELKDYAWYNMFEFTDLVEASTQLIAFGNATEDLIPIIDQLSNIASGTKKPLEEYVQLFNKAKSIGKVQAQDLQSWAAHGVVITDVMKEMGMEVDRSNIKFEDLQKVLAHLTDEGGQFAGLMESQMDNLSASWGQLQDDLANMFNEIGEKMQDTMKKGIEIGSALIDNYETIGKVLGQLVIVYGAYKTALAITIALEKAKKALTFVSEYLNMAKALGVATANQIAFNTAAMMNPYVWIAVAIAGIGALVGSIALWKSGTEDTTKEIGEQEKAIRNETDEINNLSHKLTDANTQENERKKILAQINQINPDILKGLDYEKEGLQGVIDRLKVYNEEQAKRAVVASYTDKTNEAVQGANEAKLNTAKAKDDLQKSIDEVYNAINNDLLQKWEYSNKGGLFGSWKTVALTDEDKQKIKNSFDEVLNDTTLSVEEKAQQIRAIMSDLFKQGSLSGNNSSLAINQGATADLYKALGINIENLTTAKQSEQQATEALTEAENEENEAKKRAGLTEEQNASQNEESKKSLSKYKDEVEQTTAKIKALDKVIKEIQTNPDFDYSAYGENATKALEEARKQRSTQTGNYKTLTGKDYDKTDYKKIADDIKKKREDMQRSLDESEISVMQDGLRKKLAQIEKEKQQRLAAIEKQKTELQAALKKQGKSLTAEDNANFERQKTNAELAATKQREQAEEDNAKYIMQLYQQVGDVFATEEQKKIAEINRRYDEQKKQLEKDVAGGTITVEQGEDLEKQMDKAQAKEIEDFWLSTYGNYYQKREQLTTEWEQRLAQIPPQFAQQAREQMQSELSQLDIDKFKKDIDWSGVFGNLGEQATSSLTDTLAKVQSYLDANKANLGIDEIKDLQQAIVQMEDEISNRNPFAGMHLALQRITSAKDDYKTALEEMVASQILLTEAQQEYNLAIQEEQELKALVDSGSEAVTEEQIAKNKERIAKAQVALNGAETSYNNAQKKALSARNDITAAYKNFATQLSKCSTKISSVGQNAKNLASVFSADVSNGIGKALDVLDSVMDATTSIINEIADVGKGVAKGIETTVEGASTAMQATTAAGVASMSAMEKASIILTVISAALQIATAIANLFTSDQDRLDRIEALKSRLEELKWELQNEEAVTLFEKIGDPIQDVRDKIAQARQEINGWMYDAYGYYGYLFAQVANTEKVLQRAGEMLADEYAKIEYAAGKAVGAAKFDQVRGRLENMGEQVANLQQQIVEEKNAKHPDTDAIADLERQMKETLAEMNEEMNKAVENIFGGSYEEIASQLGDAFFEAFQSGEDAAEAWHSKVRDIISQIVKQMLVAQFLEEPIKNIMNAYKEKWYDEQGNFLGIQTVLDSMTGLADELNGVQDQFSEMYDAMPDDLKELLTDSEREGTSRGIATASQDSVDENNARLTVIQGHTYSLVEGMNELNNTTNQILASVMHIADNSDDISDRLDGVETRVNRISETLQDIQLKGIKIKS